MRIGIDIDDTICDTNELIVIEADKYDKEVLGGTGIKDPLAYDFPTMMGWNEDGKGVFFADRLEYIFENTTLKKDVKEVINKLYDEGNEIYFITFRKPKYVKDPYKTTKEYLDNNGIKYNKLIVDSGSKNDECVKYKIDLFIDDSAKHCTDVMNEGVDTILFTNGYNKGEKGFNRKNNWSEIYNYIKEK